MRAIGPALVLATHNAGKVEEMRALLAPHGIALTSNADHGLPEPEETEDSFLGNARIKAHAAAHGDRAARAHRQFRDRGGRSRRRSGHLLGAMGRPGQGLWPRHAQGRRRGRASTTPT